MLHIERAISKFSRQDFVPEEVRFHAHLDIPLPIGFGQSISQPTTVQYMLEWLDPKPGEIILDLGSGSGWTTALLSELVGSGGQVYAVERIPELVAFGARNCEQVGITNARFFLAGEQYGLPELAPYDRILVNAAATSLPGEILEQLKVDGKLVIPVGEDVLEITKLSDDENFTRMHPGFAFVPLIPPAS